MEDKKDRLNIAILSPNQNVYSETFIQAHKDKIKGNIFYYYGGLLPVFLDRSGSLKGDEASFFGRIKRGLKYLSRGNELEDIYLLEKSFLKNKIDVVLAEFGPTAAESLTSIENAKIPLVVHFHGFDAHNKNILMVYGEKYGKVFDYASYIVVVSRCMEKKLLELNCPKEKIVYSVYGPHEEFFSVKPIFNKKIFLSVGRFVDKKAPYYTILAFKKITDKHPDAKLRMVADGMLLPTCKNLVKYLNLEGKVDFLGVLDRQEIKKEMTDAAVFVQHSIVAEDGDSEGTPVAIIEAGAAGLPVVSTKHAGIEDVVVDGKTGFLVKEHDVAGMAIAMEKIIRDFNLAKKMGNEARERIRNNFSMEKHISKIENILFESVRKFKN